VEMVGFAPTSESLFKLTLQAYSVLILEY